MQLIKDETSHREANKLRLPLSVKAALNVYYGFMDNFSRSYNFFSHLAEEKQHLRDLSIPLNSFFVIINNNYRFTRNYKNSGDVPCNHHSASSKGGRL